MDFGNGPGSDNILVAFQDGLSYYVNVNASEWVSMSTGGSFPVIVEFMGNGPWHENNKPPYPPDVSSGRPEGSNLGYGISGGTRYIWIAMPFLTSDRGANTAVSTFRDEEITGVELDEVSAAVASPPPTPLLS